MHVNYKAPVVNRQFQDLSVQSFKDVHMVRCAKGKICLGS